VTEDLVRLSERELTKRGLANGKKKNLGGKNPRTRGLSAFRTVNTMKRTKINKNKPSREEKWREKAWEKKKPCWWLFQG